MKDNWRIMCPFFCRERRGERGNRQDFFYCEFARFRFPDAVARREVLYGLCCNSQPDGWQSCTVYRMSEEYYRRHADEIVLSSKPIEKN